MTSLHPEHAIGHSLTLLDMATREVAHLPADHDLDEAARIMAEQHISSIVVVDAANHPVGIVTERDIVKAMHDDYARGKTLQAVMSSPVITVPANMPSEEAYHTCLARGIRHLVLVNDTQVLTGVVSETDFRLHMSLATLTGRRRVSSIMTRAVLSLPPSASLKAALAQMQAHGDNCVVVVDEERPIGIVTERDIVRLYADARAQDTLPLHEIMAHPVLSISQNGTTQEAATRMLEARVRHLVVVNAQEQLVGLISEHDLTQAMAIGLIDARLDAERHFLHTLVDTIPDRKSVV